LLLSLSTNVNHDVRFSSIYAVTQIRGEPKQVLP